MPVVSRTSPPSRLNALPKEMRVRVLGSKNMFERIAPSSTRVTSRRCAKGSISSATSNSRSTSLRSN